MEKGNAHHKVKDKNKKKCIRCREKYYGVKGKGDSSWGMCLKCKEDISPTKERDEGKSIYGEAEANALIEFDEPSILDQYEDIQW